LKYRGTFSSACAFRFGDARGIPDTLFLILGDFARGLMAGNFYIDKVGKIPPCKFLFEFVG